PLQWDIPTSWPACAASAPSVGELVCPPRDCRAPAAAARSEAPTALAVSCRSASRSATQAQTRVLEIQHEIGSRSSAITTPDSSPQAKPRPASSLGSWSCSKYIPCSALAAVASPDVAAASSAAGLIDT